MKILFDYPGLSQLHGGVSRYACEIIKEFGPEIEVDLSILYTDNLYIQKLQFDNVKPLITKTKFKGKKRLEKLINTLYANFKVINSNYDIFHAIYSDPYFLVQQKKPLVVTIHDMIYEKIPEYHVTHAAHIASKKKLIENSQHIIAISENTKRDILELYPVNPGKISVIYHGCTLPAQQVLKNEFGRYLLYVGRRTNYKNFPFFIESVSPLLLKDKELKLVCVGPPVTIEEENFFLKLGIREQVHVIGANDHLLNTLYAHALVFVFPSIYEGFGIPILEAFANNCPVCLSNTTCFPEIAGNAALYFDPTDKQSILETVQKIISDKKLALDLTQLGRERLSLFSWKRAAQQTINIYKNIV